MLALFGASAWIAMRASVLETVDHDLQARIGDVQNFVRKEAAISRAQLEEEFREHALLGLGGGLVQVLDEKGRVLYRSERLPANSLQAVTPAPHDSMLNYSTQSQGGADLRVVSGAITTGGSVFMVQVAEPLHDFQDSTTRFEHMLLILGPVFLALAGFGGLWISTRALAPVDRITSAARRISIANLSSRLAEPAANDELRRLTVTLNEMLGRIEAAVQRIVQFTADASHELRAPLTLIQTAADFSLRRDRSREDLLDAMRKIARESNRSARLIDDLLLLARADSGHEEMHLAPVDLTPSVQDAAEQALTLGQSKEIGVSITVPGEPVLVHADEAALARLWLILLDNAVKYTEAGGNIHFSVTARDAFAQVVLRDTGIGIAPEDLPKVFDRFWRADKVRSRAMGGAGLGLSIAQWIVERHQGTIEIGSEGQGSTVIVQLPRCTVDAAEEVRI